MSHKIINGDSAEELKNYPDNYFDSCVTDAPYGIEFLNKNWDNNTGAIEIWRQVYRTLKPGAYLLAFSAPRTYHRLASNLEELGFDIKDQLMWLYASGFPKSQDVGKMIQRSQGVEEYRTMDKSEISGSAVCQNHGGEGYSNSLNNPQQVVATSEEAKKWSGWKTALKPAHEPVVMARKPTKLSTPKNVEQWDTGAINVDGCRIPYEGQTDTPKSQPTKNIKHHGVFPQATGGGVDDVGRSDEDLGLWKPNDAGRYPTNVIGEVPDQQKYFYNPEPDQGHESIVMARKPT